MTSPKKLNINHQGRSFRAHPLTILTFIAYFFLALSFVLIVPVIFGDPTQWGFWIAIFLIAYIVVNLFANLKIKARKQVELDEQIQSLLEDEDKTMAKYKREAVRYCRDLIEYYKSSQRLFRTGYYCVQLSTIILSGLTPILIVTKDSK